MVIDLINKVGRTFWTTVSGYLNDGQRSHTGIDECQRVSQERAILVSSLCEDKEHAPVLDLDFEAQLIPSSTPGHFHLYLDKKMPWSKYKKLLKALCEAEIVNDRFYEIALKRKQSMVLLPGKNRDRLTRGSRQIS